MKPTIVRFSEEILKRIDQLVGEKHRAKFIRDAVLIELERREIAEAHRIEPPTVV